MEDVVKGLGALVDFSDMGGDGGVGVSEMPGDDAVLAGGVSNVGEDVVVVVGVGERSERGDSEPPSGCSVGGLFRPWKACSACRSFSLVMSDSILRSENSSRSRWA